MDGSVSLRRWRWISWLFLGLAFGAALVGFVVYMLRRKGQPGSQIQAEPPPDLQQFQGLTEEEAAARLPPSRDEERALEARQVRREIWRFSTLSIFNLGMLGLAVAQTLLGDPLSTLLTVGVLILNISFTAAQQLYATGQVEKFLAKARPLATAIRDGRIRSLPVDEIVPGDVLVAGPGDEFLADGELLSGRPQVIEGVSVSEESRDTRKKEGELILAGSYCIRGRAVYRVTAAPVELGQRWTPVQQKSELTSLQRIMARVLRLMLGLIAVFLLLLVLDMINWPILTQLLEADYRETASVFFSIAPSSLFFMIVATYALGSARLSDLGALVRDSRAVESLAQVSVLCFSKTGTLTGAQVQVDMTPTADGLPALAESRVRQLLGDLVHSTQRDNVFFEAIAQNFPGSSRPVEQAAWFLSAYGWSAVTFSEADARGTFFIGEPAILEAQLAEIETLGEDERIAPDGGSGIQGMAKRVGQFFRRGDHLEEQEVANETRENGTSIVDVESGQNSAPGDDGLDPEAPKVNILQRLQMRLGKLVQAEQDDTSPSPEEQETAPQKPELLFAYSPEPRSLFDASGRPQLSDGLVPLCTLTFEEQVRPEAREALQAFTEAGVSIKILSSDDLGRVSEAAEQLGLIGDEAAQTAVSGFQLVQMDEGQFDQAVREGIVFGQLMPEQKREIVRALRRQGERVAMVGDGVEDVGALAGANLKITLRSSSQATLSVADIVLLEDSLQVLPTVLDRGQRIVNGMLDILKINLAQIGYILLLILVMFISGRRIFYYHPTQGGVIAFFTVIVPSLGLTFWASAGTLPRQYMRSRMVHFVVPAAVMMAVAALAISLIFGQGLVDIVYSQLAVTHGLILIGLLLIVFVQPPTRFWVGGDVLSGDWRNTYMAIVLLLVFIAATYLPLTQELLRLLPLQNLQDYLIVVAVALIWLFVVRAIWRAPWLNRYVGILSDRLERKRFGVLAKDG